MENIKKLREKTGAGIVDCKKALEEANNDIEKACEILRKKGIAKASKRSGNEASEGIIKIAVDDDNKIAYILKVNSETDFVAKNDKFQKFTENILELIKEKKPKSLEELNELQLEIDTVKKELDNLSGIIGEKLVINKFDILEGASVSGYSHMGGRIGVLVSLNSEGKSELASDVAMQIAAVDPGYINPEEVPEEIINKEKDICREELKAQGKPEQIIDKIIEGKINKYFEEICLIKQEYIKDDKKKIEDILGDVKVNKFVRYSL